MEQYIGKFYADKKIEKVELAKRKTALGNDVVIVTFEGNVIDEMPLECLKNFVTPEASDLTTLRQKMADSVVLSLLAELLEREYPIEWMNFFFSEAMRSINVSLEKAQTKLWGKNLYNLTLGDVDKILKNGEAKG